MKINDLRGTNSAKEEANKHTKVLEELIEKEKNSNICKSYRQVRERLAFFASVIGGGYLAGYVLGGNSDTGVYFAEYASLIWGITQFSDIPLSLLRRSAIKDIKKKSDEYQNKIKKESLEAHALEKQGELHKYKPKAGLFFKNHIYNLDSLVEHTVKQAYQINLKIAQKPLTSTLRIAAGSSLVFLISSIGLDAVSYVVDFITGISPIELGVNTIHYVTENIGGYKQTLHNYCDNFNQLHMLGAGAGFGVLYSAKSFLQGSYNRIKTLVKRK